MRKTRIYCDASLAIGEHIMLPDDTAHHVRTVLRMKSGDPLVLFNGLGGEYAAELTQVDKKAVIASLKSHSNEHRESAIHIHLLQGLTKNDAMDFSIQKAVELGVTEITPIICERSQFPIQTKQVEKKMKHWHKIIVNACQQSWRCQLPTFNEPVQYSHALASAETRENHIFLAVERSENQHPLSELNKEHTFNIWIGPEGGFSKKEISEAKNKGLCSINLGARILKSETATVTALSLIQYLYGDLN